MPIDIADAVVAQPAALRVAGVDGVGATHDGGRGRRACAGQRHSAHRVAVDQAAAGKGSGAQVSRLSVGLALVACSQRQRSRRHRQLPTRYQRRCITIADHQTSRAHFQSIAADVCGRRGSRRRHRRNARINPGGAVAEVGTGQRRHQAGDGVVGIYGGGAIGAINLIVVARGHCQRGLECEQIPVSARRDGSGSSAQSCNIPEGGLLTVESPKGVGSRRGRIHQPPAVASRECRRARLIQESAIGSQRDSITCCCGGYRYSCGDGNVR